MDRIENRVITVSQLTNVIRSLLEDEIGLVSIQGEISNYKLHTSGHRYFTLKDETAQISCAMWKQRQTSFQPADGMKVIATGQLSVYPPRGTYQLDCISLSPIGKGDLYLAYEALKKKLEEAGYFTREHKKPLPALPLNIGVSTSPTGAAIRDILSTLERRLPAAAVYFRPTLVQGAEAAEDIVAAIRELNNSPAELIIIGRGGGSIEDLWAYNMEIVANAIFESKKPVISAVGHETDFTIADFVADYRAATPTAAAEAATPKTIQELIFYLESSGNLLTNLVKDVIDEHKKTIEIITGPPARRRIQERINMSYQLLDELTYRITKGNETKLRNWLDKMSHLQAMLKSLHPLSPLEKGFALLKQGDKFIKNSVSLSDAREIDIVRLNETAKAKVTKILPKSLFN